MRTRLLMMTLIVAVGVDLAPAQSIEEAAINDRIDAYFAALARADLDAYVASYTENAVRAIGPEVVVGRANIENATGFPVGGPQIRFSRQETRLLTPTTAIAYGAFEITSAPVSATGHQIFTLVKMGDEWLVAAVQVAFAPPVP